MTRKIDQNITLDGLSKSNSSAYQQNLNSSRIKTIMKSEMNDSTLFDHNEVQSKTKQNLSKDLDPNSITISKNPKSETKTNEEALEKKSAAASRLKRLISGNRRGSQRAQSGTNRRSFEDLKRNFTLDKLNTTADAESKHSGSQVKRPQLLTLNPEQKPKDKFIHNKATDADASSKTSRLQ